MCRFLFSVIKYKVFFIGYFAEDNLKLMNVNSYFKIGREVTLFLLLVFFTSCLTNVEEDMTELEPNACADITFATTVKPIIDANCIQCHGSGGTLPELTTHSLLQLHAGSVKSEVVSREMPKQGSLTQDEIDAIVCWVDDGALNN